MYYRRRDERLTWEAGKRGVLSNKPWPPTTLWAATVFPALGRLLINKALNCWPVDFAPTPLLQSEHPDVSFIIGHRGQARIPLLLKAVQTIAAQKGVSIECIVVEQSVQNEAEQALPGWVRYIHTPLPHPDMPYNRSWALNVGARAARGRILILHDGDLCIPVQYAQEVVRLAAQGYQVIHTVRFCFYLDQATSRFVIKNVDFPDSLGVENILQHFRGGTVAVERETYFMLGGHDESFMGWGGEDDEFFDRGCRLTACYPYTYLPVLHLYHAPQSTQQRRRHQKPNLNRFYARMALSAEQRAAELRSQQFGNSASPDPPYVPTEHVQLNEVEARNV